MTINWKQKLTSRKFWASLIGFVTALLIAFNVDDGSIQQIASIIMSGASLIVYTIAEGYVDGKRAEGENEE